MNNDSYIASYTPLHLDFDVWAEMESFVRTTIRCRYSAGRRLRATEHALSILTSFAEWVLLTGVTELSDSCLKESVVNAYTTHRKNEVTAAVAERERKVLRTLAGLPNLVEKRTVATTATPSVPYSMLEQEEIRYWAHWQPNVHRLRVAKAIAALGLGCGLTSSEMAQVREKDLIELEDGLLGVWVQNRVVPVLAEWNDELSSTRTGIPDEFLVSPRSTLRDKPATAASLALCGPGSPSPQRMRATWLLAHVEASTNIFSLMAAAGISAPDFLRRLAAYASFTPASEQASAFRLAEEVAR